MIDPANPKLEDFARAGGITPLTHPPAEEWTEQDLKDLICDALQDSMDIDWTCTTGASYVLRALEREGLTIVPQAELPA